MGSKAEAMSIYIFLKLMKKQEFKTIYHVHVYSLIVYSHIHVTNLLLGWSHV